MPIQPGLQPKDFVYAAAYGQEPEAAPLVTQITCWYPSPGVDYISVRRGIATANCMQNPAALNCKLAEESPWIALF